jgi:endonuclease/exonuclease/phosphatase family metal-dependent hydrolase
MNSRPITLLFCVPALVFVACQQNPQRIGMPQGFHATIPDTITVASYNVENLFDMVDNGDEYPEFKPNHNNWTNNTYHTKLDNIASVLAAMNADIAVLVEVENENAVRDLCEACARKNCRYPYYALGGAAHGSSVMPVVVSKFPVLKEIGFGISGNTSSFNRNMLRADVYMGQDTLAVFACHWPSKLHKESTRLENARMLATSIAELPKGKDFVVAGDFNEDWDECETFATTGLDNTGGTTGLNHVLGTVNSQPQKFVVFRRKGESADGLIPCLYDPWLELPQDLRMTTMYKGRPETPDHILLPPSMFDTTGISYVDNSFAPFTWNGRLTKAGSPYRWQMRYTKNGPFHTGDGFSDHLPVVARLCRKPYLKREETTALPTEETQRVASGTRGFEDGADGWVACAKNIVVTRDSVSPKKGSWCLAVCGQSSANAIAAKCRIRADRSCASGSPEIHLWLRGKGCLCFRARTAGEEKWTYFRGANVTPVKAGKYEDIEFDSWTPLVLSLAPQSVSSREFDIELRTKKGKQLRVFLDDVRVGCRSARSE